MKFADGIATAEDIRIEGPAAKITLTGTASVPTREYDMKGVASLNTTSGFQLPFMVQGPWDDPLIFPDPESPDPPVACGVSVPRHAEAAHHRRKAPGAGGIADGGERQRGREVQLRTASAESRELIGAN